MDSAGLDSGEQFAVTAGTYVRYVADRGVGFNIIFSTPLARLEQTELSEAGRQLISLLLVLAEHASEGFEPEQELTLLERHIVTAHGYITLYRDGFFTARKDTVQTIAERAIQASRNLLREQDTDSSA